MALCGLIWLGRFRARRQDPHRLIDLLDAAVGALRPWLVHPIAIYAAGANKNGEGQRTRETVAPLAERLGVPVNTDFGKGDGDSLIEHV